MLLIPEEYDFLDKEQQDISYTYTEPLVINVKRHHNCSSLNEFHLIWLYSSPVIIQN